RCIGLLTGLLCALHPFWIVNTAEITDGVITTFLLSACLVLGARGSQSGGALTSLLYGLSLAALALVRAALLPFAFVALLWFLLRSRSVSRGWLCAVLAVLGFANVLALWTIRNQRAVHSLAPVVDSVQYHLWIGNNPEAKGGPLSEESAMKALAQMQGEDAKTTAERLGRMGQAERYQSL